MKQEGFGRETLSNIVNNLYNVTNMRRTQQAIEAETPSIAVPGVGLITQEQYIKLLTTEPRVRNEFEASGLSPEEFFKMKTRATDDVRIRWEDETKAGTTNLSLSEYAKQFRTTIQMDPGDRAYKVERAQQRAYFTSPKFLEDVKNDSRLLDFASSPESEGKGEPGSVEYDNAYQEMRIKVVDELVKNAFPESKRVMEGGNLVWKDPEMGTVHIWSK